MRFDLGSAAIGAFAGVMCAGVLAFALMRVQRQNFADGQRGVIESAYDLRQAGATEARVWEILREHADASVKVSRGQPDAR
jgi:hypothetical protein